MSLLGVLVALDMVGRIKGALEVTVSRQETIGGVGVGTF